jgi:hypothetical protein
MKIQPQWSKTLVNALQKRGVTDKFDSSLSYYKWTSNERVVVLLAYYYYYYYHGT